MSALPPQTNPPTNQSHNGAAGTWAIGIASLLAIVAIIAATALGNSGTTPPGPTARTPTPAITRTINPCPAAGCIATRTPTRTPTRAIPTSIPTIPNPVPSAPATSKPPTPQGTIPPPVGTTGVK